MQMTEADKPVNGVGPRKTAPGAERRRTALPRSWPSVAGLLLAAAILVAVLIRTGRQAALPSGLIQVNGRMEGDLVTISSKYAGRIRQMRAREGDAVGAGQFVVGLEDEEVRARVGQAEASVRAAEEQAAGASSSVDVTAGTASAQVLQAQGVVSQSASGVASARADQVRASAAVKTAQASARAAAAAVAAAQASVDSAVASRARALAALRSAEADLTASRSTTRAAVSTADAAAAAFEKSERDAVRVRALGKEGAISDQAVDQANAAEKTAHSQLDGAREQITALKAVEASREAAVSAAQEVIHSADAGIREAEAHLHAAREQAGAAVASERQAEALQQVAREAVSQARAREVQAEGQLRQANTAPHQVAVSRSAQIQARARSEQARQSAQELKATLAAMRVAAPVSGTITTRFRDVGEVVTAGTPLLEVVDLDRLYLKVYVPEPEIGRVRLGLPAQIYVDSLPDQPFDATVTYIASTAEFTPKEVQTPDERVKLVYAVKLTLKANPQHRLTPGMPADAVIRWKPEVGWQKPVW